MCGGRFSVLGNSNCRAEAAGQEVYLEVPECTTKTTTPTIRQGYGASIATAIFCWCALRCRLRPPSQIGGGRGGGGGGGYVLRVTKTPGRRGARQQAGSLMMPFFQLLAWEIFLKSNQPKYKYLSLLLVAYE